MTYALQLQSLHFPRRSPMLALIVLMHAVAIYYINNGMQLGPREAPPPADIEVFNVPDQPVKAEPLKPLPAGQEMDKEAQIDVPLPPLVIDEQPPPEAITEPQIVEKKTGGGPIADTSPRLDPRHPLGKPPYPAQAIRLGEEGLVVVNACVQPDGHLTDVRLQRSSGYEVLDTAAVNHVARPAVRMRPATVAGAPVAQCVGVPIRFDLQNR